MTANTEEIRKVQFWTIMIQELKNPPVYLFQKWKYSLYLEKVSMSID